MDDEQWLIKNCVWLQANDEAIFKTRSVQACKLHGFGVEGAIQAFSQFAGFGVRQIAKPLDKNIVQIRVLAGFWYHYAIDEDHFVAGYSKSTARFASRGQRGGHLIGQLQIGRASCRERVE